MPKGERPLQQDLAGLVERTLIPGQVVKFVATMDSGVTKEKRFVVLEIRDGVATFVMNSKLTPFTQARPDIAAAHVMVKVAPERPFIDHDTYIDCSRVRRYPFYEVKQQLMENPSWILGEIDQDTRVRICEAIKWSRTIPVAEQLRYLEALRM